MIGQLLTLFRNELDESDNIIRNKAMIVTHGYTQIEGINFEKTFAHVAWLKAYG